MDSLAWLQYSLIKCLALTEGSRLKAEEHSIANNHVNRLLVSSPTLEVTEKFLRK